MKMRRKPNIPKAPKSNKKSKQLKIMTRSTQNSNFSSMTGRSPSPVLNALSPIQSTGGSRDSSNSRGKISVLITNRIDHKPSEASPTTNSMKINLKQVNFHEENAHIETIRQTDEENAKTRNQELAKLQEMLAKSDHNWSTTKQRKKPKIRSPVKKLINSIKIHRENSILIIRSMLTNSMTLWIHYLSSSRCFWWILHNSH